MEREFKWQADAALQQAALAALSGFACAPARTLRMDARYFDTADGALRARKIGLRLRQENDRQVCCMKLRQPSENGLHEHEEYEAPAQTLPDGLRALAQAGAPAALCAELAAQPLCEIARVRFTRQALLIGTDGFTAELALDCGTLGRQARQLPLCEIELEFKSGDASRFVAFGTMLAQKLGLTAENRSKLARALAC